MREIIVIEAGNCGIRIGEGIWKEYLEDNLEREAGDIYLCEGSKGYSARCICMDLDPYSMKYIENGIRWGIYNKENIILGERSGGNNWGKGHYTDGAELMDKVLQCIQTEVEKCSSLSAFSLIHSLGGGTGSGMGTLLLTQLKDLFPSKLLQTYSVFPYPSPQISHIVSEPYNALLSLNILIQYADYIFPIDNLHIQPLHPDYIYINSIIRRGVLGLMDYPHIDPYTLRNNLVLFPNLNFLTIAHMDTKLTAGYKCQFSDLFKYFNPYSFIDRCPKYMDLAGITLISHGCNVKQLDVHNQIEDLMNNNRRLGLVGWMPDNLRTNIRELPNSGVKEENKNINMNYICNSVSVVELLKRIGDRAALMLKHNAFIQYYVAEGMDSMEFTEALDLLNQVIDAYLQYT